MSEDIRQLYERKQQYFLQHAIAIVGNKHDAEDAIQNAFIALIAKNGSDSYRMRVVEAAVEAQCAKLVERRQKRPEYIAMLPEDDDTPSSAPQKSTV